MRVSFDGELFRASHISGPTHNYLGLRLIEGDALPDFPVKVLPSIGDCCPENHLSTFDVGAWIAKGIEVGNKQANVCFCVTYAEVVENDHPVPQVYAELARRIVLAAHERADNRRR